MQTLSLWLKPGSGKPLDDLQYWTRLYSVVMPSHVSSTGASSPLKRGGLQQRASE
jgi:hypothetical protein